MTETERMLLKVAIEQMDTALLTLRLSLKDEHKATVALRSALHHARIDLAFAIDASNSQQEIDALHAHYDALAVEHGLRLALDIKGPEKYCVYRPTDVKPWHVFPSVRAAREHAEQLRQQLASLQIAT